MGGEATGEQLVVATQAQMGGAAEVAKPITYCLTPEQAAANGAEQMAKRMAEGNCTVARFDAAKAKAVPGVKHVVQISTGVAVVADGYWAASKGATTTGCSSAPPRRAGRRRIGSRAAWADPAGAPTSKRWPTRWPGCARCCRVLTRSTA